MDGCRNLIAYDIRDSVFKISSTILFSFLVQLRRSVCLHKPKINVGLSPLRRVGSRDFYSLLFFWCAYAKLHSLITKRR